MSCNKDVHICHTNFAKRMEQNLYETTSRWKTYGKQLFSKDLEVQDDYKHGRAWEHMALHIWQCKALWTWW
jgi:hypothetical protein